MKSLYEGTRLAKATLIITDESSVVAKRKKERSISRRANKNIKWWVVDAPKGTEKYDKGKGGGPWVNYDA